MDNCANVSSEPQKGGQFLWQNSFIQWKKETKKVSSIRRDFYEINTSISPALC